jgi:hypothetical protein
MAWCLKGTAFRLYFNTVIIIIISFLSPGNSPLEPMMHPTNQASSFRGTRPASMQAAEWDKSNMATQFENRYGSFVSSNIPNACKFYLSPKINFGKTAAEILWFMESYGSSPCSHKLATGT